MKALLVACIVLGASACATGRPVGGRFDSVDRYEPFAPVAEAREIPPAIIDAPPRETPPPLVTFNASREAAVSAAVAMIGKTKLVVNGKRYGNDCTSFVQSVFEPLGINLMLEGQNGDNGVTAMWRTTSKYGRIFEGGRPLPGDLVFFKETYDVNRDGRVNDGLTHIGIVEDVEADGTVLVIHRVARGVVRYRMNVDKPTERWAADGRKWNDWLRTESPGSKPRLTGELFAGYGTLLPVEQRAAQPSSECTTDCDKTPTGG